MKEIYLIHKTEGKRFDIPSGHTKIGRAQDNQLILKSESVSRLHALLVRENDSVWLTDLGSVTGTFVNGDLIGRDEARALSAGDELYFGQSECLTVFGCSPIDQEM